MNNDALKEFVLFLLFLSNLILFLVTASFLIKRTLEHENTPYTDNITNIFAFSIIALVIITGIILF